MRALSEMPLEVRRGVRGVLADIDDTLTTHGQLTAERVRGARAPATRRQAG